MSISIREIGEGMDKDEAMTNARRKAKAKRGEGLEWFIARSKLIRKPKPASRCNIKNIRREGTRKWVTTFLIESAGCKFDERDTKDESLTRAKELALKYETKFDIVISKKLTTGDTVVATVEPESLTIQGQWEFTGWSTN